MVTRIVAAWYQLGQDQDYPLPNFSANTADATGPCYPGALFSPTCVTNEYIDVQADHANVARNISREAITMLKNDNNTLPLSTSAVLKIFGSDAQNNPAGINSCNERGCDTGVLGMGWGSGKYSTITRISAVTDSFRNCQLPLSRCSNRRYQAISSKRDLLLKRLLSIWSHSSSWRYRNRLHK